MSINFNKSCITCINQILNINDYAFNDISTLKIFDDCGHEYDLTKFEFSYSLDNVCWTCYMKYDEFLEVTAELNQDFYLRMRMSGVIGSVTLNGEQWKAYSTSLDSSLTFSQDNSNNTNIYNPYINMDCALSLYYQMTEMVSNIAGIGCYYFKLAPHTKSKDITFKEYTLMDVAAVKQVKLIIADNQMPSSKPEFSDWGLDFSSDWEVETSKMSFATAFGNNAKPMEGDLIYIPMMKRMWMVNGAYEEKKDAFMWTATTFKLTLVKYQEKDSVDLGESEALVNSFVKNKYEDLFGDNSNTQEFDTVNNDPGYVGGLYNIYEADSIRKSLNIDKMDIEPKSLYHKGTLISDMQYVFKGLEMTKQIEYQFKFCGENGSISFIISSLPNTIKYDFIKIGNLSIKISQKEEKTVLYNENSQAKLILENNKTYFVYLRWSKVLRIVEFGAAEYKYNEDVPLYKLQPSHYYFDLDNINKSVKKYNIEMIVNQKSPIIINNFKGYFTNLKVYNEYIENISELLQMYPSNGNLIVNDTARKIVSMLGGSQL